LVFNKLDAIEKDRWPLQMSDKFEINVPVSETPRPLERVFVSAKTGDGLPLLRQVLSRHAGILPADESPHADESVA
jgi:GTP-binding protein HflX